MQKTTSMRLPIFLAIGLFGCFSGTEACCKTDLSECQARPNIIVINLDDADYDLLSDGRSRTRFPNIHDLANGGIRFTNTHCTIPLCGPSRACLLRGQYAHNTGIKVNRSTPIRSNGFEGGMKRYQELGHFENDISVWMKGAGYRTMMVGKFLHSDFFKFIPPGWDDFYSYLGGRYYEFFRLHNESEEGRFEQFPPGVYRTNVETENALDLIERQVDRDPEQPFFLLLQPLGPHREQRDSGGMIDEKYKNEFAGATVPASPSFNEFDFSDKRGWTRELPLLDRGRIDLVNFHYRNRLIATKSLDDMVGEIRAKLVELGIEDQTYVILTSDNGYSLGDNRWVGKGGPFSRASKIPLIASGPNVAVGKRADHLIAHIDITATLLDLAGVEIPELVDGKSFAPLLQDPKSVQPEQWQHGILVENWETNTSFGKSLLTVGTTLKTFDGSYTEHANGEHEYYRTDVDPSEVINVYDELSPFDQLALSFLLKSIKNPAQPAVAKFSTPFEDNLVFRGGIRLHGLAEDAIGVESVKLVIQDRGNGLYWDGDTWTPDFTQVQGSLATKDSGMTEWHYLFQPAGDQQPAGNLGIWVWAFDGDGQFGPPQRRFASLQSSRPQVDIRFPMVRDVVNDVFVARGEAVATEGIDRVLVFVRDINSGLFWDGSSFVEQTTSQTAEWTDGQWRLPLELPPGKYRMSARAISPARVGSRVRRVEFTIE